MGCIDGLDISIAATAMRVADFRPLSCNHQIQLIDPMTCCLAAHHGRHSFNSWLIKMASTIRCSHPGWKIQFRAAGVWQQAQRVIWEHVDDYIDMIRDLSPREMLTDERIRRLLGISRANRWRQCAGAAASSTI
jgi:exoribonuclease II